jgi:type IV pilus assembly protein PilQ
MGKELIRLKVTINNSQPDESTTVDGIPGIISNAATTSVIVGHGRTAVIAGLIKNVKAHSTASIPFLSKLPIIGGLFSNFSDSERNNELVIFITPQVVTPENDLRSTQLETVSVNPSP